MSRIRTIKPSFFHDLGMGGLPIPTRLTYVGLWTYSDDAGRAVDDARLVKAEIWPLDDTYTTKKVDKDLELLAATGRICRYEHAGRRYFHIIRWKHQRINRPQPSLIPPCPNAEHAVIVQGAFSESAVNGHGTITEESVLEGKGREGKGTPLPPTGGERRTASARTGRRPTSEQNPAGAHPTATLEAVRAVDLAKAEACQLDCDRGWLITGNAVARCACQAPE